jgi:hypothetical protein
MYIFKISLASHLMAVQRCLREYQAEGRLTIDFVLEVRARNRCYTLYPQFIGFKDGRQPRYARHIDETTKGFIGWLPYFNKRWPIGSGKLAFKDFCQRNGLRTPAMWRAPAADMRDFLTKHDNASFGAGIRGPFRGYDARDAAQLIGPQGYYEAFIRGRIVKATYWDGRLAAVEIKRMTNVKGDGESTLRQLIAPALQAETPDEEWQPLSDVAAYQGLTLDAVPEAGRSVMVDFRYASYANVFDIKEVIDPEVDLKDMPLLKQLLECGPVLWQAIPEALRPASLFTVDAIEDDEQRLWLLEMNCNPVCHPRVYPLMFETLFGAPEAAVEAPPLPASALPNNALAPMPFWRGPHVPPAAAPSASMPALQRFRAS